MKHLFKTLGIALLFVALLADIRAQTTPSVITMQDAATATGNGTAIVVGVNAANPGANLGAVGVQIVGSGTWEVTFEATTDGTNWSPVMATNLEDDVRATTATAAGQYTILYGSAIRIRARISSFSSGSVTVKGRLIPGLTARLTSGGGGGGGSGDVVGPASATDNAVARFNLTTGKLIQNSVVTIADSTGDMAGVGTVNTHTIPGGTDTFALLAASQSLTNKKLGSLTSNGLVTTSGGDGTLGVTVPGSGVLTALAVNTGSAGAFVVNGGALGTPSSGTLTNATGLPLSTGVTGDLPFANFVQAGSAGFVGATGAGDYSHRTPAQVTAALDNFVGDSGAGGTKGLVPAPVTGDATKFLKGDGTWATVSASPGGSDTQLQRNNAGAFGGISGATSDGTNVTFGSGNLLATSPVFTTDITTPLVKSAAGAAIAVTATAPTATTGASQAGVAATLTASPAVASTDTAGAAAGGSVTITAGNAARLTSGNANGGDINLIGGAGIGTGTPGKVVVGTGSTYLLQVGGTGGPILRHLTNLGVRNSTDGAYTGLEVGSVYVKNGTQTLVSLNPGASTAIQILDTGVLGWSSTNSAFGTNDTFIRRDAAANIAFGVADAASPVAQTLSVQNVVGGTSNTAGATWTLRGSLGTSQGVPGRTSFTNGGMIAASGTTQQTAVSRLELGATKVLTNNSATTIVNVTNATETSAGGVLDYCVEVTDATDVQYECGMVTYGISNKGGVFSGNTTTKFGNHQNATAGTLTVTFAISGANPGALSVNANSSLSPSTGYPRIVYSLRNLGNQAVAVQ